jgi:hypothetical protein
VPVFSDPRSSACIRGKWKRPERFAQAFGYCTHSRVPLMVDEWCCFCFSVAGLRLTVHRLVSHDVQVSVVL